MGSWKVKHVEEYESINGTNGSTKEVLRDSHVSYK